jgi:hypothetical protein
MKLRPVLLLTGPLGIVPEILVAYISSVMPAVLLSTDIVIDPGAAEGKATNLKSVSALRLHKLATIHTKNVIRHLGTISAATRVAIETKLRGLLQV